MFENLQDLTPGNLAAAADALYRDGEFVVLMDEAGVLAFFRADARPVYAVDFAVARSATKGQPKPPPLSPLAYATAMEWAKRNVPKVCRAWREHHPDAPRAPSCQPRRTPRRRTRAERNAARKGASS